MFISHPMVSVTVFIVSRGSHWPDAYFSMCDIKSLSIYLSIYMMCSPAPITDTEISRLLKLVPEFEIVSGCNNTDFL